MLATMSTSMLATLSTFMSATMSTFMSTLLYFDKYYMVTIEES